MCRRALEISIRSCERPRGRFTGGSSSRRDFVCQSTRLGNERIDSVSHPGVRIRHICLCSFESEIAVVGYWDMLTVGSLSGVVARDTIAFSLSVKNGLPWIELSTSPRSATRYWLFASESSIRSPLGSFREVLRLLLVRIMRTIPKAIRIVTAPTSGQF